MPKRSVAFVSKLGGSYAVVRLLGEGQRSALPTDVFSMLVIMAPVSTFIATPLIRRLTKGQERPAGLLGEPAAARG